MTMLYENIRLAIFSLKANKMRALLTMLGIIIGIGSVIAIMTVGDSVTATVTESMSSMGVNNITVMVQERKEEETS
ncbi:MAG: ABC transporter permease, partial [Lachnospiraceae bacterium]|nr:ABC transporter permease [Lachnospiraceae bacterium]